MWVFDKEYNEWFMRQIFYDAGFRKKIPGVQFLFSNHLADL